MARAAPSPSGRGAATSEPSAVAPAPASRACTLAPRAFAASARSSTSAAAPSPSTKPSRALSNGREARSGSSLRVLMARIAAKPAMGSGWTHASVPPTRTTSARSKRSRSRPQRMASAPDAQALTGACTPPLAPIASPTAAAGPLGMSMGMVKGETRLGPFSSRTSSCPRRVSAPPMPVPKTTAIRSGATPESAAPEAAHACSAAMTATCWLRSSRRARTRSIWSAGSEASRATSCAGYSLIQSSVIRLTPDRPARRASQVVSTSPPRGVVAPSPVTTTSVADVLMTLPPGTAAGAAMAEGLGRSGDLAGRAGSHRRGRRRDPRDSALVLLDVVHGVAHGLDVGELVVGDGDPELVLDGGGDLDHRQGVDVEVIGERLLGGRVGGRDAGDLLQDLGQTGLDVLAAHAGSSLSKGATRQGGGSAVDRDTVSRGSGAANTAGTVTAGRAPGRRRSGPRRTRAPGRDRPTWPRRTPSGR